MDKKAFERLWVARLQGLVAAMLLQRGTQPSEEEMAMLSDPDFTMRELAEIADECGMALTVTLEHRAQEGTR